MLRPSYQGTAAEQDHEDDQGLKPVVLHYQVAGLSQEPPALPPAHSDVNVTALILGHTSWGHTGREMTCDVAGYDTNARLQFSVLNVESSNESVGFWDQVARSL